MDKDTKVLLMAVVIILIGYISYSISDLKTKDRFYEEELGWVESHITKQELWIKSRNPIDFKIWFGNNFMGKYNTNNTKKGVGFMIIDDFELENPEDCYFSNIPRICISSNYLKENNSIILEYFNGEEIIRDVYISKKDWAVRHIFLRDGEE